MRGLCALHAIGRRVAASAPPFDFPRPRPNPRSTRRRRPGPARVGSEALPNLSKFELPAAPRRA